MENLTLSWVISAFFVFVLEPKMRLAEVITIDVPVTDEIIAVADKINNRAKERKLNGHDPGELARPGEFPGEPGELPLPLEVAEFGATSVYDNDYNTYGPQQAFAHSTWVSAVKNEAVIYVRLPLEVRVSSFSFHTRPEEVRPDKPKPIGYTPGHFELVESNDCLNWKRVDWNQREHIYYRYGETGYENRRVKWSCIASTSGEWARKCWGIRVFWTYSGQEVAIHDLRMWIRDSLRRKVVPEVLPIQVDLSKISKAVDNAMTEIKGRMSKMEQKLYRVLSIEKPWIVAGNNSISTLGACVRQGELKDWTILQENNIGPDSIFGSKKWDDYKKGFQETGRGSWLGLDEMHKLTSTGNWQILVSYRDCGDHDEACAIFDDFKIDGEDSRYEFHVGTKVTSGGGGALQGFETNNNKKFATADKRNGHSTCPKYYEAGWWFGRCYVEQSCPNCNLHGHNKCSKTYMAMRPTS